MRLRSYPTKNKTIYSCHLITYIIYYSERISSLFKPHDELKLCPFQHCIIISFKSGY